MLREILSVLIVLPAAAQTRVPPPMFSPRYVESLRDLLKLEERDAAALEQRLAVNPSDYAARLKLMAYSMRADRLSNDTSRALRPHLVSWLIQNEPGSELLASPYAVFQPDQLTPAQAERLRQLWQNAVEARKSEHRVMWNAARFYHALDRARHLDYLEAAVALAPDNVNYGNALGIEYGQAIVSGDGAERASRGLTQSPNAAVLALAARVLHGAYVRSRALSRPEERYAQLARQYFQRAKSLDPALEESSILPTPDPKMDGILATGSTPPAVVGQWKAQAEEASRRIRRLSVEAFPELPPAIAAALRSRGCRVPQPWPDGPPKNVIRGDFIERGKESWAVLCSIGGASTILVFGDLQSPPDELARGEDTATIQDVGGGELGYSRQITAVGRDTILSYHRAYGGTEPPPIDHAGINDAFVGKASVVRYFHDGKWLTLTGAD